MKQAFKIIRRKDKLSPSKIFKFRQENLHAKTAQDYLHLRQQRTKLDISRNVFLQRATRGWNSIGIEEKSGTFMKFWEGPTRPPQDRRRAQRSPVLTQLRRGRPPEQRWRHNAHKEGGGVQRRSK